MNKAFASNIERHSHPCATLQRPCEIACSALIADVEVQTPQGSDSQGSLLFLFDNRQLTCRMGTL